MKVRLLVGTLAASVLLGSALDASTCAAEPTAGSSSAKVGQATGDVASDLAIAATAGTLDKTIQHLLNDGVTEDGITALSEALASLVASDASIAARVAEALSSQAFDLAGDEPQAAVDLAKIAVRAASDPAVLRASPDHASVALGNAIGAADVAERAAGSLQTGLSGAGAIRQTVVNAIQRNPDVAAQIQDSVDLASVRALVSEFGPTGAGADPGVDGGSAAGGGGDTPVGTPESASPT